MPETRFGLQQRYTMDQILELHGGKNRIQPLNYNALTQLRNPLYVKMGQALSDASTDQNTRILAEINAKLSLAGLASENNLPHDALKEVLSRAPSTDDDDDMDSVDEDPPPGGPGRGGVGGPGGGPSGGGPPPGGGGKAFNQGAYEMAASKTPSSGSKQGSMSDYARDHNETTRKPPPDPPANSTALFRSNLEMLAQMEQLREETRRAQQQNRVVSEVHHHHTTTNVQPMREIIREIHGPKETFIREIQQQLTPPPAQDNTQLLATLQAAMAQNVNLSQMAQQMGLSMAQLVELMRKSKAENAVTSSNRPPPPPPPGPMPISIATPRPDRSRSRQQDAAQDVEIAPVGDRSRSKQATEPSTERSRSRAERGRAVEVPPKSKKPAQAKAMAGPKKPAQTIGTTAPVAPSRDPSLASTVNYGPSREPSIAKEIERSRSRQAGKEAITLPYSDQSDQKRGRSPERQVKTKMQRIVDQLVKSEGVRQINKHSQGMQFAKRPAPPRPASTAPIKVRTFDEILGEPDTPVQKQRTTSEGAAMPRRRLK